MARAKTKTRRPSRAKPSNTTAIAVTSFVGGMLAWHLFGGQEQEAPVARKFEASPRLQFRSRMGTLEGIARPIGKPAELSGVKLEDSRLRIEDWSKWMKWTPAKMDLALDAGAKTAGDVLKVLLNLALPGYAWPPEAGSILKGQWDRLQTVVAEGLHLPDLPPDGGSEVDDEEEEEKSPVKLRLVT